MSAGPLVVLDACVLANFSLCDTLLRLAEAPPLYEPRWSAELMAETVRTLESELGWPAALTSYFQSELLSHFGDAWVTGHGPLISRMSNHETDRHVLAAAVCCGASIIVTLNVRHFRKEHLEPWGVVALHPHPQHRLEMRRLLLAVQRRCLPSIVVPRLKKIDARLAHLINQSVLLRDTPGPAPG